MSSIKLLRKTDFKKIKKTNAENQISSFLFNRFNSWLQFMINGNSKTKAIFAPLGIA